MAKILIVDDSKPITVTMEKILAREKHAVEIVYDAELAFQRVLVEHFDLVTMDISMPGLSGEEAILAIETEKPQQRILVISATKDKRLRKELLEDCPNVVGWLEKPFDYTGLAVAVREALEAEIDADGD